VGGKVKDSFEDWFEKAQMTEGSWWPHWQNWIETQNDQMVDARKKHGGKKLKILGDAPGTFVKVRT
ncbi:MAG: class I poly(R)-hydroxyalkanoic acid synthase, partial [Pseudomonadota bacterium]